MLRLALRQSWALHRPSILQRCAIIPNQLHAATRTSQTRLESSSSGAQQQKLQQQQPEGPYADASDSRPANSNIYKQFGRPFAKVFLGAMFTYQLLYWAWEKMRLDEVKEDRRAEIKDLEQQVDAYKTKKSAGS